MILKGASRASTSFFTRHLLNEESNERVDVKELRGFTSETVPEAFQELSLMAAGTRVKNAFYHLSINPDPTELNLTPEQWQRAVEVSAEHLGLSDQPRMVIEHEKNGRRHQHIIFSRIDADSMTAISDSHNYQAHDRARHQLEQEFSHEPTPPTPEPALRKSREFAEWETWRGAESGIDPKEMKAEITELWQQSDGGRAFAAGLDEKGYLLAKGDRRDFVVIDEFGQIHSLARRIDGAKTADIRAKFSDLDRDSLMTAQEASAWMKAQEADSGGSSEARILPQEQAQEVTPHTAEPPAHPLLTPPLEYVTVRTMQEIVDAEKAMLRHRAETFTPAHWANLSTQQWDAWDAHNERLEPQQEMPRDQQQSATFTEREQGKQREETWLEFVTRQQEHDRDAARPKETDEKKEPDLER
jgi:hypothetical protein